MKKLIKNIIFSVAPNIGYYITALNHRRNFKIVDNNFQSIAAGKLYKEGSIEILSGPFKGTKYINETVWGPITPKWLGSYEEELHPIVETIIKESYKTIIDIGSAEGYYVIGFARRMPHTHIFSFDVDPISRRQQKKLVQLNKLNNITIGKYCHYTDLEKLISDKTLIICDIEGYEYNLLNPTKAPKLLQTDLLVELHPFENLTYDTVADTLQKRFEKTHDIATITQKSRESNDYYNICNHRLNLNEIKISVNELRGNSNQFWFWIRQKK